jgi:hypothetical protein
MVFELNAQFIEETASVTVDRWNGAYVLRSDGETRPARDLGQAIRLACEYIGPLMECGDRLGEGWGLLVTAGRACVGYGNWPAGPPAKPSPELEGLRRILREYRPSDGARAALSNACRVIEAYAERAPRSVPRAA